MLLSTIIYMVVLILLAVLVHRRFNLYNFFNPFVMFFIFHAVFLYIGWFFYLLFYQNLIVVNPLTMVYVCTSLTISVVAAITVDTLYSLQGGRTNKFPSCVQVSRTENRFSELVGLFVFLVGVCFLLLFYLKAGSIPLLHENSETFRIEARKGMGYVTLLGIGFVTFGAMVLATVSRDRVASFMFIGMGVALVLGLGNRAPAFKIILAAAVLRLFWMGKKIPVRKLLLLGGVLYFLLVLIGALRTETAEGVPLFQVIGARFFWRPIVNFTNISLILDHFSFDNIIWGKGFIQDISVLLPGYQPNFGTWLKDELGLTFAGGSVTPTYIGEAYVNFGLIGVVAAPFIYGAFLQILYIATAGKGVTPVRSVVLLTISLSLMGIANMGIITPMLYGVAVYLTIYGFFVLVRSMLKTLSAPVSTARRPGRDVS